MGKWDLGPITYYIGTGQMASYKQLDLLWSTGFSLSGKYKSQMKLKGKKQSSI